MKKVPDWFTLVVGLGMMISPLLPAPVMLGLAAVGLLVGFRLLRSRPGQP